MACTLGNNLVFFNRKGNALNFNYDENNRRYEGNLFFDPNSDDTYKSLSVFTFESIPAFDYQSYNGLTDSLYLNKFQLFNEYGIDFTGSTQSGESVTKIEVVNRDPKFYSKWIYGDDFESKFPKGTEIKFDTVITEFGNQNITYTVVDSKKNAILIISNTPNDVWYTQYGGITDWDNVTISGVNAIEVRKYVDSNILPNLSEWSEPFFYDKLFIDQKINIVNTESNDGIVTVKNLLLDNTNYSWEMSKDDYLGTQSFYSEVTLYTQKPKVYEGIVKVKDSFLYFTEDAPDLLRPNVGFKLPNSLKNTNEEYVVDFIPEFDLTPGVIYGIGNQVMWDGEIYDCIQSYTQSSPLPITGENKNGVTPYLEQEGNEVTPDDVNYWQVSKFIPVVGDMVNEDIFNCPIYLTSNVVKFEEDFDTSNEVTLSKFYENYVEDFYNLGVRLTYKDGKIDADLEYSSKYAVIDFYNRDSLGELTKLSKQVLDYEKVIEVEEYLVYEENRDISERLSTEIVFTDIDEYGLLVTINGIPYRADTVFYFNGAFIDLEKTIDKTLRNWKEDHLDKLLVLGIIPELEYSGYDQSPYVNTIKLSTTYPNVELDYTVKVGTTADYYIERYDYIIKEIAGVLNVTINGVLYTEVFDTDITTTLSNFVENNKNFILQYGIIVKSINQILKFSVYDISDRIVIDISVGIDPLPGIEYVKEIDRFRGNMGSILTANSIINSGYVNPRCDVGTDNGESFEDECFSTGQIVSVNNSDYVINNQEYNILYLDPTIMGLSYQGPFWGNSDVDIKNAFLSYAFDCGFGYDPDAPNVTEDILPPFQLNYILKDVDGLVDINYVQPIEANFIVASGSVIALDSKNLLVEDYIDILGDSIKEVINPVNQLNYVLTDDYLYAIDTTLNTIAFTQSLSPSRGYDIDVNSNNGDIYVSYRNSSIIRIYDVNNNFVKGITLGGSSNNFEFDKNENIMFVGEVNNNQISEISGDGRSVVDTFATNGLLSELYYNPFNNKVYGIDNTSLFSVSSGSLDYITGVPSDAISSMVYNPETDYMYISLGNKRFYVIDTEDNVIVERLINDYGYLTYSNYDGHIYIASKLFPRINLFSTVINNTFVNIDCGHILDKIVYNQYRQTMIGISSLDGVVIEVKVNSLNPKLRAYSSAFTNAYYKNIPDGGSPEPLPIGDNLYGTLDPNYSDNGFLLLKTREYLRRPRKNYDTTGDPKVTYTWKWQDDQTPEIFMYDFSGDFLTTEGAFAYKGEKPLKDIRLNYKPNNDLNYIYESNKQQTVFPSLSYELEYVDSGDDLSIVPEPIPLYLGFNSRDEGVKDSTLLLVESVDTNFDISYNVGNNDIINLSTLTDNKGNSWCEITIDNNSTTFLNDKYLVKDQLLKLSVTDSTNDINQYISYNSGKILRIREVYPRKIVLDILNDGGYVDETNVINDYPIQGQTTILNVNFDVVDDVVGYFRLYAETEIEDIRYKIELNNTGKNIAPEDVYIFKEYDINEQGIDWTYLNKKRKEMTVVRNDIYNYIGSYKSIINAINYFGYNDLELYEYYRNINRTSKDYNKLIKIEIPDVFDPSVQGWEENAFILNSFPNQSYDITNMFNLAFRITDVEGVNVLTYSLEEVIIKLMGLKKWLSENIIPLSHKILDITGRADTVDDTWVKHDCYDSKGIISNNALTPIDFDLPEAYVMPVISGSTVYNSVIQFKYEDKEFLPDYFSVKVRTYRIYPIWDPFITYTEGQNIRYLDKLYTSLIRNNRTNNPTEYENVSDWRSDTSYTFGELVRYNGDTYQYQLLPSGDVVDNLEECLLSITGVTVVNETSFGANNGAASVSVSGIQGVVTYLWVDSNGIFVSEDNVVTDLAPGDYTVTVTDNYTPNCQLSAEVYIYPYNDNCELNIDQIISTNETYYNMNDGVVEVVVSGIQGNVYYTWTDSSGDVVGNTSVVNGLSPDEYTVEVSDDYLSGCLVSAKVMVSEFKSPCEIVSSNTGVVLSTDFNSYINQVSITASQDFINNVEEEEVNLPPDQDSVTWFRINVWKEIPLEPVQTIDEFRLIDKLHDFLFTIDVNIDPYIVIEVTSDDGYGSIYTTKKSYELSYGSGRAKLEDVECDSICVDNCLVFNGICEDTYGNLLLFLSNGSDSSNDLLKSIIDTSEEFDDMYRDDILSIGEIYYGDDKCDTTIDDDLSQLSTLRVNLLQKYFSPAIPDSEAKMNRIEDLCEDMSNNLQLIKTYFDVYNYELGLWEQMNYNINYVPSQLKDTTVVYKDCYCETMELPLGKNTTVTSDSQVELFFFNPVFQESANVDDMNYNEFIKSKISVNEGLCEVSSGVMPKPSCVFYTDLDKIAIPTRNQWDYFYNRH